MLLYQTYHLLYMEKDKNIKISNLEYLSRHGMKILNYLMDDILYQIFKITFNIS